MSSSRPQSPIGRTPRAGLLFVGVLLLGANLRAGIAAVGPVLPDIEQQAGLTASQAGLLVSLPLVAFAVVSPFAPWLSERLGLERVLGLALAALAVGIVVRSVPGPGFIWIGTVVLGSAIALMNVLIPALIKRDWPLRIGSMTGAYQAVTALFAALASGVVVPVAGVAPSGWRVAVGIWAALAIIGFAVLLPWIVARRPPETAPQPAPAVAVSGVRDEHGAPRTTRPARRHTKLPLGSALAWQVTIYMGFQSAVYYTIIAWLPTIQVAGGTSGVAAGWYLFAFQLCGLLGNLTAASVIPRTRSQSLLGVGYAGCGFVGVLGLLTLPGAVLLWILLIGLCTGGAIVLAMALFGLRAVDYHQAAGLSSMAQSIGYLIAAGGPLVIGLLHDVTGAWAVPLIALLGVTVVQGVFIALAGRHRTLPA